MNNDIQIGDRVTLLGLPDWLLHDLPKSEQLELRGFIGHTTVVVDIDLCGYFWLGFAESRETADSLRYSGPSFCVPRESISRRAD
ncbi:hypothetical protein [Chitinimonas lacunae]|uniref:Uncharacterized protein n=1 Tax=Chitinimonas lacunae TaxID=1963018 RepID=A0ABV8MW24_9NEIS